MRTIINNYRIMMALFYVSGMSLDTFCHPSSQSLYHPQACIAFARKKLINHQGKIEKPLFNPQDDIKRVVIGLISAETTHIRLAMFLIQDTDIIDALIAAQKRGVRVEVVTCKSKELESATQFLMGQGIQVYFCPSQGVMHLKNILFSRVFDRTIWSTGSYNFTYAAATRNKEDLYFNENSHTFHDYVHQFALLKATSEPAAPITATAQDSLLPITYVQQN